MFHFALKNILFYRSRSITTVVLTFISTLLFVVYVSMMDGSHNTMLSNSLKIYTGAIEIYQKGYRDIGGSEYLIEDVASIEAKLKDIKGIKSFTSRYETYGLLSHKDDSSPSMVAGVNPTLEINMSQLSESLVDGEFLRDESNNSIYMGANLVKKLNIKIGDEVSFIGSASDGSFSADIFILSGIFKTGSFDFDSSTSFLSRGYLDSLLYAQNYASYITISVDDLDMVDSIKAEIEKILPPDIEVLSWKELMKGMVEMMLIDSIFGYVSMGLFFVVIFFVIMIFGFINVSSRLKELGVLRSIGIGQSDVRALLFYEILILSSFATLIATPLGAYISYYFSVNPIVIDGLSETYQSYGIVSDKMYLNFDMITVAWNVGVIYILNFLSVIYPIYYVNSFTPIEASKHV